MSPHQSGETQTKIYDVRILLTGGAGYIGSHTAVHLLSLGHDISILDDLSNSSHEAVSRVEELSGRSVSMNVVDLTDPFATSNVFTSGNFDAVVHFAGLKAVGESVADPIRYYRSNLVSTLVLLQTMADFGVTKLVFSSSATVYGTPDELPVSETNLVGYGVTNPYGQTKVMIEQILADAAVSNPALEIAVLRYFNPIGAHRSGRIGEDPKQIPNNLVPLVSQVAAGVREQVAVFGNGYDTPDGTGVRDYVHVMDLAEGHAAALSHLRPGFSAFNLGTGRGTSVLEIIAAFSAASGHSIPYRIDAARAGDIGCSFADVRKAQEELGWSATRSLGEACRDAWRWQSNNPNGYLPNPALAIK